MKKIVLGFVLAVSVFSLQNHASALEGIIPAPAETIVQTCGGATDAAIVNGELDIALYKKNLKDVDLGQKIKGGCVQLSDVPFIVIHLIDLCTKLAGTIAVIFILYAGFQLILSGVTDDREAAKNTIKYAITGLVVSFLAWVLVNLVQVQLTT